MAQVMKYYEYPPKGNGSLFYLYNPYGYISANFGNTYYNWSDMPDSLSGPNPDVAQFVYDCGVSVNMQYGPDGSGAYPVSIISALTNNFGYPDSIKIFGRPQDSISNEIWKAQIKIELDNKRPVIYAGFSAPGDGHCFVCDGYDNSFPTKFHFNWGWGGDYNGYFAIGALNSIPGNDTTYWNYSNSIITNIKPPDTNHIECELINPMDCSVINSDSLIKVNINIINGKPNIIRLYIDNILKDSITNAPYNINYPAKNLTNGKHFLKTIASNNKMSCTDSVVFYVLNNLTSGCWKLQHSFSPDEELNIQETVNSNISSYLSIIDSLVVWVTIGGSENLFTKTTDGGLTWQTRNISNPAIDSLSLSNIFGIDSLRAYACFNPRNGIDLPGLPPYLGKLGGAILYTNDGGVTWTNQPSADFSNCFTANWVYFFDENNGVCMGENEVNIDTFPWCVSYFVVYTTNNAGKLWNKVPASNIPPAIHCGEYAPINSFDAYNNSIWFGTNVGRIYKSFDKGLTWSVQDSIYPGTSIYYGVLLNVKFKDSLNVFAYRGIDNVICKTHNAGKTWAADNANSTITNLAYIPGTQKTWININFDTELSTDDDSTFSAIDESIGMTSVRFISTTAGWGVAPYSLSGYHKTGGIYKWVGSLSSIKKCKLTFHVVDKNNQCLPGVQAFIGLAQDFQSDPHLTSKSGDVEFDLTAEGNPYTFDFYYGGYYGNAGYGENG